MNARLLSAFFLFYLILPTAVPAQASLADLGCGTVGRSLWLDKYQAGKIPPLAKSLETTYVPIHLTIVGEDNGGGYADPLTLLNSFAILNADFAKINVQFYIDEDIDYINSSIYYDHDFEDGRDLLSSFGRSGVFNNFVVGNPAGNCGYYSPSEDAVVLGVNCINGADRTWSHEVGHYLGLPHTFFGWESIGDISKVDAFDKPAPATLSYVGSTVEVERVDGSNCTEAADGFCDTAPDYLPGRWLCDNLGLYPDSLLDPDSTRFAVSGKNIMSYANDGCVDRFSPEQTTTMITNLGGRVGLTDRIPPAFNAARGEDLDLLAPADRSSVPYSDEVTLVWNAVDQADFYLVQLNISSNFKGNVFTSFFTSDTSAVVRDILDPNRRYYWRVRPVNRYDVSGSFSEPYQFRNGAISTATIDPQLDAAVVLSPNPVSGGQVIQLSAANTGTDLLSYQLVDPAGRVIAERSNLRTVGGSFREVIETDRLAAGLYFLRLTLDGRLVTRKVIVTPG